MVISMSRPARPWENAYCESFMNTLKREQIKCSAYTTMEELALQIEEFIERYYNRERLHSALKYCSPDEHERKALPVPALVGLSFPRYEEIYPDA